MKGTTFIDFTEFFFPDSDREIWMVYSYYPWALETLYFLAKAVWTAFGVSF